MNKEILLVVALLVLALGAGVALFFVLEGQDEEGFIPADEETMENVASGEGESETARRNVGIGNRQPAGVKGRPPVTSQTPGEAVTVSEAETILEGVVLDPEGKPLAGALVMSFEDRSDHATLSLQGDMYALIESDGSGRFRFEGLPAGDTLVLRVDHLDYASWTKGAIVLQEGNTRNLKVRLDAGIPLTGEVQDVAGNPLPETRVMVYDVNTRALDPTRTIEREVMTDASGKFEFKALMVGIKKVTASKEGYASVSRVSVNINKHKAAKPLSFVLDEGSEIRGRIVDQDGAAIPEVLISAEPIRRRLHTEPSGNYPSIKSDENGEFVYGGLKEGVYKLACHKKGYGLGKRQSAKTGSEVIQIQLKRRPVVRGRVLTEDGKPATKFSMVLARNENLIFTSNQAVQRFESENGEFEFIDLVIKGDFYLFAQAEGYGWSRSDLIPDPRGTDTDGVLIQLKKGSEVTGRVLDSGGKPIAGARVELTPKDTRMNGDDTGFLRILQRSMKTAKRNAVTNKDGVYTVKNVHEGNFVARAKHASFAVSEQEQTVFVDGRSSAKMPDLVMLKGGTIEGIVEPSKDGKSGADCLISIAPKTALGGGGSEVYTTRSDANGRFVVKNVKPGIYFVDVSEREGEPADLFGKMLMQHKRTEIIIGDGETQKVTLQ